ncbi:CBS domain containing-hemolysin-like protein [Bacillus pakistanensis]|uniref:CBS domain containing-hemolysin-like protein n=1 Tax=Rossellomorea pakistanensis TaxID=992288 RepID=A0ABS2NGP7_9BACI|nr:hemolysin family protein [Bacillus pakistanensis]MBM7587041.1 CBS domain containing-hemolysin-like protein [Bacillus pakistanensis]
MEIINLVLVAILIALTGFFVATEFAIVKVRSTRIDQLIEENKAGAKAAKQVITHLDEYLSACQLGITITALGLGWLGEPTVEKLLHPVFERFELNESLTHILSFGIAFAVITFLHVVVGELAPKTVAIQKAEAVTIVFAKPIIWFYKIMYPFIWALNGSARILVGIFGLKPASEHETSHTEEELRLILSESYKSGEINQAELKYVNNIFEFDNRLAKEIMVPRTEMVYMSLDDRLEDIFKVIKEEKYTRYPVANGDTDHIKGIVNIKDILTATISNKSLDKENAIVPFIKPVIQVIETIPIHDLLLKMQKERTHMAILMDEYGGTSGIVTVEDILEEIVGEIRDEFDTDELPEIRKISKDHFIVNSKVLIEDVNDLLGIELVEDDVDTLGGWFLTKQYDVKLGDVVEEEGYIFKVIEIDGHQIIHIEITMQKNAE